ncbi:MAG: hypothetical protein AB8G11_05335 [Saprospiraceae bacterium]
MNKTFYNLLLIISILAISSCSQTDSEEVTMDIYKWESNGITFTTYFYEINNNSERNLLIDYVIEATCNDGTVYSDQSFIEVSAGKTRKSSSFFNTDGKKVEKIDIVDIKSRFNPF